jgi:hypothetical protein
MNLFSNVFDISNNIIIEGNKISYNNYWKKVFTNYDLTISPSTFPCFKEDSKILTDKGYQFIQDLRKGDLIKTLNHGFKAIEFIGKCEIYHSANKERIKDQLYVCNKNYYPEIIDDLVITGGISLLVDNFINKEEREMTLKINGDIIITDNKYRLPSCVDERAFIFPNKGTYSIYYFAFENKDYNINYGIYANGLLVASFSQRNLKELYEMF